MTPSIDQLRSYFRQVPLELVEVAASDGHSKEWRLQNEFDGTYALGNIVTHPTPQALWRAWYDHQPFLAQHEYWIRLAVHRCFEDADARKSMNQWLESHGVAEYAGTDERGNPCDVTQWPWNAVSSIAGSGKMTLSGWPWNEEPAPVITFPPFEETAWESGALHRALFTPNTRFLFVRAVGIALEEEESRWLADCLPDGRIPIPPRRL